MQNATIPGVVRSVERHRKTLHIGVSSDEYGLVFLILSKGQCSSSLLKEGRAVSISGVKAGNDKFTAKKIVDPSLVERKKKPLEVTRNTRNFFNISQLKFAPRFG